MSVDFKQHPLVEAIGEGIDELFDSVAREAITGSAAPASSGSSLSSKAKELALRLKGSVAPASSGSSKSSKAKSATQDLTPEQLRDVSSASGVMRRRVKPIMLITLEGFLGKAKDDDWVRLYRDAGLNTWLVIRKKDVVNRETRQQAYAPYKQIDILWLSQAAQISRGRRQPQPDVDEARLLEGDFLTAGDILDALPMERPSGARSHGIFCNAGMSPNCCTSKSHGPGY